MKLLQCEVDQGQELAHMRKMIQSNLRVPYAVDLAISNFDD